MHVNWNRSIKALTAAVALLLCAQVSQARADPGDEEGSEWNAWILSTGWCNPCLETIIGNPIACPCRIADPIIVK